MLRIVTYLGLQMYGLVLGLHSLLRWAVLLAGLLACARGMHGWGTKRRWTAADDLSGLLFMVALDIELLVGLVLYAGVSPIASAALRDMGAAMATSAVRFFVVEHPMAMIIGVALAHVGRVRVRRAEGDSGRFKSAALLFGLALIVILLAIPWPWMPNARPLLPGG